MQFSYTGETTRAHGSSPAERAVLTAFTRGKEGHSPQPRQADTQVSVATHGETPTSQSGVWLVKAKEDIVLAPRCRQAVVGRLETQKERGLP